MGLRECKPYKSPGLEITLNNIPSPHTIARLTTALETAARGTGDVTSCSDVPTSHPSCKNVPTSQLSFGNIPTSQARFGNVLTNQFSRRHSKPESIPFSYLCESATDFGWDNCGKESNNSVTNKGLNDDISETESTAHLNDSFFMNKKFHKEDLALLESVFTSYGEVWDYEI